MRSSQLTDIEILIAWGESLSDRLRVNPAGLNLDELECPPFMLSASLDAHLAFAPNAPSALAVPRIGFMHWVRHLAGMESLKEAGEALRRVAKIRFVPAPDQLVPAGSFLPYPCTLGAGRAGSGMVLSVQTVRDYQRDLAEVVEALKSVRDSLLRGTERRQKQTVDRDQKIDRERRREIVRLYLVHRHAPDGYVYPICAGLDDANMPLLSSWLKKMEKAGITAKDRNWCVAYVNLRHPVESYLSRLVKRYRETPPADPGPQTIDPRHSR